MMVNKITEQKNVIKVLYIIIALLLVLSIALFSALVSCNSEERIREFEEILAHPPPEQCKPRDKPPKPNTTKYKDTPTAKAPSRSIWIPPGSYS